jgi:hypothetical protein
MAEGAANWLDRILPRDVPLRQYVLTVPFELRARLAYDDKLLSSVCRIVSDSVLGWYRRKFGERGVLGGQSGAITVIQRLQADLRLGPHSARCCSTASLLPMPQASSASIPYRRSRAPKSLTSCKSSASECSAFSLAAA